MPGLRTPRPERSNYASPNDSHGAPPPASELRLEATAQTAAVLRHSAHLDALHADPIRDWQLHLRDGASLAVVLPHTAERFGCAIVLPNLKPPVSTVATAAAHRKRILAARPKG